MNNKKSLVNYVHLGFQTVFIYLTVNFLRAVFHEIGHGLAAWIVGLDFVGFYSSVFGSSGSFIDGARTPLQSIVISSSGPLVDLLIGLIVLFSIFPRLKNWGVKISGLLLATATLMSFWGLMMSSGFGAGDFSNIALSIGIPKFVFGISGLLGLIGVLYMLAKRIFDFLSDYFPLNSFRRKFAMLFLFLGLPTCIWVFVYFLITSKVAILGQCVFVVIILCLLSSLIKRSSDNYKVLPIASTFAGGVAFIISCIIWLSVFGTTLQNAKGIFW